MQEAHLGFGPARSARTMFVARMVAGLLILMLLAQLFGYESFASILAILMPFNDQQLTDILAAKVVIAELLALPYLLGMPLSRLMRGFSLLLGTGVVLFWLFTSLTSAHAGNAALFSDTLLIPGGILAFLFSALLSTGFGYVVYRDLGSRTS